MDQKKKQMMLLGVLGALALGAGGYYVFVRDSGGGKQQAFSDTPAVKRERAAQVENKATSKKKEQKVAQPKQETAVKRERAPVEESRATRREKSRDSRKIEKKEEMKPAA